MAVPSPLVVRIDGVQRRVVRDGQRVLCEADSESGSDFEAYTAGPNNSSWIEPSRGDLLIRPAPMMPGWTTSSTGIYARTRKSAWTFNGSGSTFWTEWEGETVSGDWWLSLEAGKIADEDDQRFFELGSALASDRGVWLGWFNVAGDKGDWVALECGWGGAGLPSGGSRGETAPVSLRFYASGRVEVYRHGSLVKIGSIGNARQDSGDGGAPVAEQSVGAIVMPWRERELLVYGATTGEGFSVVFEDIAEGSADPIVGSAKFWMFAPFGRALLQFAPLSFPSSGVAWSKLLRFPDAPQADPAGDVPVPATSAYWTGPGTAGVELTMPDGTTTFSTLTTDCRLKFTLTASAGAYSPAVFAGYAAYPVELGDTDGADEFDLTPYLASVELEAPEEPESVSLLLRVRKPDDVVSAGGPDFEAHSGRPVTIEFDGDVWFEGVTEPAERTFGTVADQDEIEVRVRDKWVLLERTMLRSPMVLDGLTLAEAFEALLDEAGVEDTSLDAQAGDFTIQTHGAKLVWVVEAGETIAEAILRLHEQYCPLWVMGFRPKDGGGTEFFLYDPRTIGGTATETLYSTVDAAETALSDAELAPFRTYRRYQHGSIAPEANEIHVMGWDPRTDRPILVQLRDEESADPTLARDSRPGNWLGATVRYALVEPRIRDRETAERCARLLYDRLTPVRFVGEWESDLATFGVGERPLWRGGLMELDGVGVFRIASFSFESLLEEQDDAVGIRRARYVGEFVPADGVAEGAWGAFVDESPFGGFVTVGFGG